MELPLSLSLHSFDDPPTISFSYLLAIFCQVTFMPMDCFWCDFFLVCVYRTRSVYVAPNDITISGFLHAFLPVQFE